MKILLTILFFIFMVAASAGLLYLGLTLMGFDAKYGSCVGFVVVFRVIALLFNPSQWNLNNENN